MMGDPLLSDETTAIGAPRWLETPEGGAPVLLIAPHGGRAGPATHAMLNPKVNDLHTADITRELAWRLDAGAIINAGMDRNQLDLNRLSQVMSEAPWMLELIAARLERIVARSKRAVVLVIHGWNVIEPRVDLGVGIKSSGGKLLPARGAHVSASDGFINGPLLDLAESLRRSGIKPSFGLRYPGAGPNNLLQAFTQRHASSPLDPLRRLAALNACGALEAVQLELSVTLRMPGRLRVEVIDAIARSFAGCDRAVIAPRAARLEVVRTSDASPPAAERRAQQTLAAPSRVGLEFYDGSARVGAMASFDLGAGAAGARVMMVLGRERIALFTAEGRVERTPQSLVLGPLTLRTCGGGLVFEFAGPAVVVEDGAAYLSVEHALAKAALQEAMELYAEFDPWPGAHPSPGPPSQTLIELITHPEHDAKGIFGRLTGRLSIAGTRHRLEAAGRLGRSFTGIGKAAFRTRRMIWAAFPGTSAPRAVEARTLTTEDGAESGHACVFSRGLWADHTPQRLELAPAGLRCPPEQISLRLQPLKDGHALTLGGEVRGFVMLSRPGSAQSRILTSLGFATFRLGDRRGVGMFECSQRSAQASHPADESAEADNNES